MIPTRRFALAVVLVLLAGCNAKQDDSAVAGKSEIEVYFSPNGGCTEAVVRELGKAQKTVYVQAYSFTSKPIAQALVDAHKRGVDVQVVLDKSQRTEKYSRAPGGGMS